MYRQTQNPGQDAENREVKMMNANINVIEGKLVADGIKVGIVASRFNEFIVSKLIGGALDGLLRHDVKEEDITLAWVPEPLNCRWLRRRWPNPGSMMPLSAWEPSSAEQLLIMISSAMKRRKESHRWVFRRVFRSCSA